MARHYASVPAGSEITFPRVCPFTGRFDPQGRVRLAKTAVETSTNFGFLEACLAFFGLHFIGASTPSVRVPADRGFAWKAGLVEFAMWTCFVAAVFMIGVILVQTKSLQISKVATLCLAGAMLATLFLKVWHYCLLRPVVLGEASDYFVEIGFLSEDYALEFASLNKVFVETR